MYLIKAILWISLLGASHNYNDIETAERAAAEVFLNYYYCILSHCLD